MTSLSEAKQEVMEGFADDFDTKRALDSIMRLVHAGNATFSQPSNVSIGYELALILFQDLSQAKNTKVVTLCVVQEPLQVI